MAGMLRRFFWGAEQVEEKRSTSNGCLRAKKRQVDKLNLTFRGYPQFCVATIDYGTTHCSVHVNIHPGKGSEKVYSLDLENKLTRVPNSVLFNSFGKVIAFGNDALNQYIALRDGQRMRYSYFDQVKKGLQRDKSVSRSTTVKAVNGKEFYLLDVIAHTLDYLKTQLMKKLRATGFLVNPSDIDWVITVPAIWTASGKQMMREAGYKAGLCSSEDVNLTLDAVSDSIENVSKKPDCLDKLSLALEPESAALHWREEVRKLSKDARKDTFEGTSNSYIVVDIGGGTVDIACHRITKEGIEAFHPPVGNASGGTTVNEEFQRFLEDLLNDKGFTHLYVGLKSEEQARRKAYMWRFVYHEFEEAKKRFGSDTSKDKKTYIVRTPGSFWRKYGDKLMTMISTMNDEGSTDITANDEETQLIFSPVQMAKFFQPTIESIAKLLVDLLSGIVGQEIDTIYWAGGFGGSAYLRQQLQSSIQNTFGERYHFYTAIEPAMAVVRGATLFRCNPDLVYTRKADASYGVNCMISFDKDRHDEAKKFWSEGKCYCKDIFCTYIEMGESICAGEVFVDTFTPMSCSQTAACFDIYSARKNDVWYTDLPEVKHLGEVRVTLEGEGLDRPIEVVFDMTHIELQVRAYQTTTMKEFKTVVDLLK